MREQFALEMKREQQILDEQRKIGKDVLDRANGWRRLRAARDGGGAPREEFGGSTNVLDGARAGGPGAGGEMSGDRRRRRRRGEDDGVARHTRPAPAPAPLPEQSTQILADALPEDVAAEVGERGGRVARARSAATSCRRSRR